MFRDVAEKFYIVSGVSIMQYCILPQGLTYMLISVMIFIAPNFLLTYQL